MKSAIMISEGQVKAIKSMFEKARSMAFYEKFAPSRQREYECGKWYTFNKIVSILDIRMLNYMEKDDTIVISKEQIQLIKDLAAGAFRRAFYDKNIGTEMAYKQGQWFAYEEIAKLLGIDYWEEIHGIECKN